MDFQALGLVRPRTDSRAAWTPSLEQHFFGQKRADKAFLTQIFDCFAGIFRGLAWSDPGVDWGFYFYINGLWLGWGWWPV